MSSRLTWTICLFCLGLAGLPAGPAHGAGDGLSDMIVELVSGSDNDMRNLGLQQVREAAPGEAATRRFAGLLSKLPPGVQVQLLDALAERGDRAARPAVLAMLDNETAAVRVMAARALGKLGDSTDVPALARISATGPDAEKAAARESLRQLRAAKVDDAIVKAMRGADAETRVVLIGALTARGAKEALPRVLENAEAPDLDVRLAVLEALRALADSRDTAAIVRMLKSAGERAERKQAERALLAVCGRGRVKCADAVIDGLDRADGPARISLVRALVEAGGAGSLKAVVARMKDEDASVRGEAVRALAGWPDADAAPYLRELAGDAGNLRNHVLAIRGLVRLACPGTERPADLALLGEAMRLASRTEEKVLVLGTLGTIATSESLALVEPCLEQPELREAAASAAVSIAERHQGENKDKLRALMRTVAATAQDQAIRDRAKQVLDGL